MAKKVKSYSLEEIKMSSLEKSEHPNVMNMNTNLDVLGKMIKKARLERSLTQEQLGDLVGVKKAQISKLENSANSCNNRYNSQSFQSIKIEINFNVRMQERRLKLV